MDEDHFTTEAVLKAKFLFLFPHSFRWVGMQALSSFGHLKNGTVVFTSRCDEDRIRWPDSQCYRCIPFSVR
jgi:hypothetical protein